jgi:hypothetical protein
MRGRDVIAGQGTLADEYRVLDAAARKTLTAQREALTKEVLQRAMKLMAEQYTMPNAEPYAFVIRATEERANEIAAEFGVEWTPDENGTMVIGEWHIMTGALFP